MENNKQWFLIADDQNYGEATTRYEEVKYAIKDSVAYKEKLLLVHLISEYENKLWDLPIVNPVETIKIRMEEFGLKQADLAREFGNKGNLSKVLNYQRALSLSMIRWLSIKLQIPTHMLTQEYELKTGN